MTAVVAVMESTTVLSTLYQHVTEVFKGDELVSLPYVRAVDNTTFSTTTLPSAPKWRPFDAPYDLTGSLLEPAKWIKWPECAFGVVFI